MKICELKNQFTTKLLAKYTYNVFRKIMCDITKVIFVNHRDMWRNAERVWLYILHDLQVPGVGNCQSNNILEDTNSETQILQYINKDQESMKAEHDYAFLCKQVLHD